MPSPWAPVTSFHCLYSCSFYSASFYRPGYLMGLQIEPSLRVSELDLGLLGFETHVLVPAFLASSQINLPGPKNIRPLSFSQGTAVSVHWGTVQSLSILSVWNLEEAKTHLVHGQQGASQMVLVVKTLPANAGDTRDTDSVPGSGRPPGGGHGNPLQDSYLENPMARGAWRATIHGVRVRHD